MIDKSKKEFLCVPLINYNNSEICTENEFPGTLN